MRQPIPPTPLADNRPEQAPDAGPGTPAAGSGSSVHIEREARADDERRRWRSRAAWTPRILRHSSAWK